MSEKTDKDYYFSGTVFSPHKDDEPCDWYDDECKQYIDPFVRAKGRYSLSHWFGLNINENQHCLCMWTLSETIENVPENKSILPARVACMGKPPPGGDCCRALFKTLQCQERWERSLNKFTG